MPFGSFLSRLRRVRLLRASQRRNRRRSLIAAESLDARRLLSTLSVLSASTADSRGVTVDYQVAEAGDPPPSFAVYRSADAAFDATDQLLGMPVVVPALDESGLTSAGVGVHRVTIPIAGGLPINPEHPYVVVVANPGTASAGQPGSVASFRKSSIAIVTHGGIQNQAWKKNGPPWTLHMAKSLRAEGYDAVIAYNWVGQSRKAGKATEQAPRLAAMIRKAANKLPAGEPVDLHFIGHSEGTVINSQTIVRLDKAADPEIQAGTLEDTLLDPHAANPDAPGKQYSTSGPFGWIAKLAIDSYQSDARDPLAFVPKDVDSAQVFYQQTPANRDHGTNSGIYNLWGQVPVKGKADYFNLTQAGIVHSGKQGVYQWYEHHVVPELGDGAPDLAATTLTKSTDGPTVTDRRATYTGMAEPGAAVRLSVGHGHGTLHLAGKTVADANGTWTATTRPLAPGTYRVIAESKSADWTYRSHQAIPTTPLGALVIERG